MKGKRMRMKGARIGAALLTAVLAVSTVVVGCSPKTGSDTAAREQKVDYPTKPIDYVVPFAPGGGVDLVARVLAEYASKEWGQPVNVVNKAGGGGAIGAEYALKQAKKDGYTVLADNVSTTSMLVSGMLQPPVKIEERTLVSRVVLDPIAFVVKADAPWKDLKEFTDWAKQNPQDLTWTSVGAAGTSAFAVADLLTAVGADFSKTRMVVTTGAADSVPKVAGGHAILAAHTVAEVYPMVSAGKVKVLGVAAAKRSPYYPDVPTLEEQGIKGVTVKWWTGVTLPAGTPDAIVKKWEELIAKASKDASFQEKLKNLHVEGSYQNSQEFTKFVLDEVTQYTKLATERGMRK